MREGYNSIAALIDPSWISERLLGYYGTELMSSIGDDANERDRGRQLSREFIEMHRLVEAQKKEAEAKKAQEEQQSEEPSTAASE